MKLTAKVNIAVGAIPEMTLPAWADQFTAELRRLPEHVAQSFLDRLELLFSQGVIESTKPGDGSTVEADHIGITVRIVGTAELLAAARAAT